MRRSSTRRRRTGGPAGGVRAGSAGTTKSSTGVRRSSVGSENGDGGSAVLPAKSYVRVKVLTMGEAACGKSCLVKRFCEGKFITRYISTIGVDFGVKQVTLPAESSSSSSSSGNSVASSQSLEVKVNFWDLSGHPEFFEVRNEFYRDTQAALLVFDVTSRASFQALDAWLSECTKFGARDFVTVVCGNKVDLEENRLVTREEAQQWAEARGFVYFETSARSGDGVDKMFHHTFRAVVKQLDGS